ncbi:MAG: energy transducer TonB [Bacteroidota bacterium]|nr:energy transducer TonB [Bacteroidota bacterium]
MQRFSLYIRIRFLQYHLFGLGLLFALTKKRWFFERKIAVGVLLLTFINLVTTDNKSIAQNGKQNKINKNDSIPHFSPADNSPIPDATPVDPPTAKPAIKEDRNPDVFCYVIEEMPTFPEGDINEYLARNVVYPPKAIEQKQEGRVIIQMTIDSTGYVINPRVMRGVSAELDSEALRVVKAMPRWIPGRARSKVIGMHYTLPINFRLNSQKK